MKLMSKKSIIAFISFSIMTVTTACSDPDDLLVSHETTIVSRSLNQVKFISQQITDGDAANTYLSSEYELGKNSGLLLRLEGLTTIAQEMLIDDDHRVFLKIVVKGPLPAEDQIVTALSVCPLSSNWMMLATWYAPHPFGETWQTPGGDYSDLNCIDAYTEDELVAMDSIEASSEGEAALYFDVGDSVIHTLESQDQNYGWLLKSDENIKICGDLSYSCSPRLIWRE